MSMNDNRLIVSGLDTAIARVLTLQAQLSTLRSEVYMYGDNTQFSMSAERRRRLEGDWHLSLVDISALLDEILSRIPPLAGETRR